jgi:two-component system nitrate/nitrite response regulator NarL
VSQPTSPVLTLISRPASPRISIVFIDDNLSANQGVVARIRSQPGFRVLATLAEAEVALKQVCDVKPDIVLLNLRQQGDDTLTLAGALHGEAPDSRVIIMGLLRKQVDVASFIRACVRGFVMVDASFDVLLDTIQSVARGGHVLPLELTHALFGQLTEHETGGHPTRTLDIKRLTKRERAVTDLIVRGLSNKEIAAHLQIALHTVKGHVHNVLSKLEVNTRLEIAAFSRNRIAPAIDPPPGSLALSARDRIG